MAEAQVRADLENLENAKNALEDAVLYAPFSGYIDQQYVENRQIVAASQPIISMIWTDLNPMPVGLMHYRTKLLQPGSKRPENSQTRPTGLIP